MAEPRLFQRGPMTAFSRIAFALAFVPCAAHGQSREAFEATPTGPLLRPDVAGSRQLEGMAAPGVRFGPALVQPSLTVRAEADSNVFNRTEDKKGDAFVVFAPTVQATAESGRASYVLRAEAALARYASVSSQDYETFGVDANGSIQVSRGASLFTRLSFDRKVESSYSSGASDVEGSPAEYAQVEAQVAARADLGDTRITASVTVSRLDYADIEAGDGARVDQAFRDSRTANLGLRAEHALAAGPVLLFQGNYLRIDSMHPATDSDRSAEGGRVMVGTRGDLGSTATIEALAGYVYRHYDSPAFKDYDGAMWRARLEWYATPLLTLAIGSDRAIVNSGLREASGAVVDTTTFQMFYEMRRRLNWVLTLAAFTEDQRDAGIESEGRLFGVEGRYLFNSQVTLGTYARYRERSSRGPRSFREGEGFEGGLWLRGSL